jgi:hypothetical protein
VAASRARGAREQTLQLAMAGKSKKEYTNKCREGQFLFSSSSIRPFHFSSPRILCTLPVEELNRQYKVTWSVRVAKTVPSGTRFTFRTRVKDAQDIDISDDVEVVVK